MTTTLRPQDPPHPVDGPVGDPADGRAGRSTTQTFSICSNGRPIGSVRVSRHGQQAWIGDLEVAPERRRRGHGSVAVLAAEEVLRGWNCLRVEVNVPAAAEPARSLFEALGYGLDRQRMVKRLGPKLAPGLPARLARRGRRRRGLPPGARVRPLRADEYQDWLTEEIAEFADSMAAHSAGGRPEALTRAPDAYAALLPDGLRTPGMAVQALEVAGRRVGTVLVSFTARDAPGCGWIYHVLVHQPHRGHGYGRALLLVAEQECRAAGLRGLGLNVYADNPVALTLYASLGYQPDVWVLAKQL